MRISDQVIIQRLHHLDEARYHTIDLDHLIMYAVGEVQKLQGDLSFENIVAAAFALFPKKFLLLGYPSYPDSDRVMNCLNRCTRKNRQWLGGKSRHGFFVTDRSRQIIEQTESLLTGVAQGKSGSTSQTRRKESILAEVTSSIAYQKFADDKKDTISLADVCFVLQGTLDTSRDTLKGNLKALIKFAEELQHNEVLQFANWLQQDFESFFEKSKP